MSLSYSLLQVIGALTARGHYAELARSLSRRTQAFPPLSPSKTFVWINEATECFITRSSELKLNDATGREAVSNFCLCHQQAGYRIMKINPCKLYGREFIFNKFPQKFVIDRKTCRFYSVKARERPPLPTRDTGNKKKNKRKNTKQPCFCGEYILNLLLSAAFKSPTQSSFIQKKT